MSETFQYAAFISYSSNDAPFAKRLHRAIEGYRIPSALGKFDLLNAGKTNNRIYPVFRDREELSAGDLGERIQEALRNSRSLIVVCSPHAAASPWVQKEIEYFISLGRRDQIFAIISSKAPLRGLIGEDATLLSFPSALKPDAAKGETSEAVAADARPGKDGFRNAALKLIAGIIGVTPGRLIDRDKARRLGNRIAQGAGAAALAAAATLGIVLFAERDWRGEALRQASAMISEGRNLDALPLVIAAAPPRGAVIAPNNKSASEILARIGAVRIRREFGWQVHSSFSSQSDPGFVVVKPEGAPGLLYDLSRPSPPQDLGIARPILRLGEYFFSEDGNTLIVLSKNGPSAYYDMKNAGARHDLGQLRTLDLVGNNLVVLDHERRVFSYDLSKGGQRRELGKTSFIFAFDGSGLITRDAEDNRVYIDFRNNAARHRMAPLTHTPEQSTTMLGGSTLFTARGDQLAYYDLLNETGRTLSGAPGTRGYRLDDRGHWLLIDDTTYYDLDAGGTPIDLGAAAASTTKEGLPGGRALHARLTNEGDVDLYDLSNNAAKKHLGNIGAFRRASLSISGGGAALTVLATRPYDDPDRPMIDQPDNLIAFDLVRNQKHDLGDVAGSLYTYLSSERDVIVATRDDGAVVYHNFANGLERRNLGDFGVFADSGLLRRPGINLAESGASLVVVKDDDKQATFFDLTQAGTAIDLGKIYDDPRSGTYVHVSPDGKIVVARSPDGAAVAYDVARRPWQGAAPRGAELRAAVCAASAQALRPLRRTRLRSGDSTAAKDAPTAQPFAGRPWNPCDWPGIGAILPNASTGDGWFEGLRQWIRLVSVRHFGAADWTCEETTSGASPDQRAWRKEMCNLHQPMDESDFMALDRIAGRWSGTYVCDDVARGMRLEIRNQNGAVSATQEFYPLPGGTVTPAGAYTMRGTFNSRTRALDLNPIDWVQNRQPRLFTGNERTPYYVEISGLTGALDANLQNFTGRLKSGECPVVLLKREGQ